MNTIPNGRINRVVYQFARLKISIQAGIIFTKLFHFNLMIINQCRNFWKRVSDYFRNFLAKSVERSSFKLTAIHFYLFNAIYLLDNSSDFFFAQSCVNVNFVELQLQKRRKINIRYAICNVLFILKCLLKRCIPAVVLTRTSHAAFRNRITNAPRNSTSNLHKRKLLNPDAKL